MSGLTLWIISCGKCTLHSYIATRFDWWWVWFMYWVTKFNWVIYLAVTCILLELDIQQEFQFSNLQNHLRHLLRSIICKLAHIDRSNSSLADKELITSSSSNKKYESTLNWNTILLTYTSESLLRDAVITNNQSNINSS